jgi:hypothetical protein
MSKSSRVLAGALALMVSALCQTGPVFAQRSDRATISGVVTDNQGSAVPWAATR